MGNVDGFINLLRILKQARLAATQVLPVVMKRKPRSVCAFQRAEAGQQSSESIKWIKKK